MKKIVMKLSALLFAVLFLCVALVGCDTKGGDVGGTGADDRLPAPHVTVDKDGLASWDAVEGALYYAYTIDGGAEKIVDGQSVQLTEGQTIEVRAVSNGAGKADSEYSAPVSFHAAEIVQLSFYAVNDLHGKFMDSGSQPGVDEFTTYIKDLYKDPAREEILLSSGDMWQGTVESSSNKGKLMTEWMNDVGFVSMTLGNHEYDWGPAVLTPNSELAEFPFLAINVTYQGQPAAYCQPSTVVERKGVKIGIIGAIGDCLSSISGEFQDGLSFATGAQLTSLVKTEATRLREEENCDLIVYSIHDGTDAAGTGIEQVTDPDMEYYDTSLSDGYVDLVFEGHTHMRYILQDEYGVYHLQGGGENKYVSCADVTFNKETKDFTVEPRHIANGTYGSSKIEDDPIVEALYEEYFPDSDPYEDVLGRNTYNRKEEDICAKVAELYLECGQARWDTYDIVLAGGYLNTRNPYSLGAGEVTYADLYSLLPFDNDIILGRISGRDLKSRFFEGRSYVYTTTVSASEISSNALYYIVIDSYTAFYRRNNITIVERYDSGVYARDLLADFIQKGGWA